MPVAPVHAPRPASVIRRSSGFCHANEIYDRATHAGNHRPRSRAGIVSGRRDRSSRVNAREGNRRWPISFDRIPARDSSRDLSGVVCRLIAMARRIYRRRRWKIGRNLPCYKARKPRDIRCRSSELVTARRRWRQRRR